MTTRKLGARPVYGQDHEDFRASARRFVEREVTPHFEAWEAASIVDRDLWRRAGEAGMLCPHLPELYGGTGDFRYNAVFVRQRPQLGRRGRSPHIALRGSLSWFPSRLVVSSQVLQQVGLGVDPGSAAIMTGGTSDAGKVASAGQSDLGAAMAAIVMFSRVLTGQAIRVDGRVSAA